MNLNARNNFNEEFILLTLHRAENVDDVVSLKILAAKLQEISHYKIIFPIHPRTKKNLEFNKIKLPQNVITINPAGYLDFLALLKKTKLVLTDSGGVQEEAIILGKPCITLRNTTERSESILMGANRLYPLMQNNENFGSVVEEMLNAKIHNQPYGESVTTKTVNLIEKILVQPQAKIHY
jgi:UDP-N-acetylglucosamine 2-epimerase